MRHIIFHAGQNLWVKYLLQAMDKVQKCKRQSDGKKLKVPKVPKLNIEAAQAIQGTIPTDIPLPDLGNVEAFLTSN